MAKTSNEVKWRWKQKAYKQVQINFRYDTDAELIKYIESHKEIGTTQLFREALEAYIEAGGRG